VYNFFFLNFTSFFFSPGPIHLERRDPNLSSVFKGEILEGNQERLSTTNQCYFPKVWPVASCLMLEDLNTKCVFPNWAVFSLSARPHSVPRACGRIWYQDFKQCKIWAAWSGWMFLQYDITGAVPIKRSGPSQATHLPT